MCDVAFGALQMCWLLLLFFRFFIILFIIIIIILIILPLGSMVFVTKQPANNDTIHRDFLTTSEYSLSQYRHNCRYNINIVAIPTRDVDVQ